LPDFEKVMKHESEPTRLPTDKLKWNFSAFVQYALKVIAIIQERKKAENMRKRALTGK
jgi:hypothetical protein